METEVDPPVLEELTVFGGHEGHARVVWDFFHGNDAATFDVELADDAAVPVQDPAGDGRAVVVDAGERWGGR